MRSALLASLCCAWAVGAEATDPVSRAQAVADRLIASLPGQLAALPGKHSDRLQAGIAHLGADSVRELASMRAAIATSPAPKSFPPLLVFATAARQWGGSSGGKSTLPVSMPTWRYYVTDLHESDYRAWALSGDGGVLGQRLVPYARDRYLDLAGDFYSILTAPGSSPGIGLARALGIVGAASPAMKRTDTSQGDSPALPSPDAPGQGARDQNALNVLLTTGNASTEIIDKRVQEGLVSLLVLERLLAVSAAEGKPLPMSDDLGAAAIADYGTILGSLAEKKYKGLVSTTKDDPIPETEGVFNHAHALVDTQFHKRYTLGTDPTPDSDYDAAITGSDFHELVQSATYLAADDVLTAIGNLSEVGRLMGLSLAKGLVDVGDLTDADLDLELGVIAQTEAASIQWAENVSWKGSGENRWFDKEQYDALCAILRPGYQAARSRAANYFGLRLSAGYLIPRNALHGDDATLYRTFSTRLDALLVNNQVLPTSLSPQERQVHLGRRHRAALLSLQGSITDLQAVLAKPDAGGDAVGSDGYRTAAELLGVKDWSNQVLLGSRIANPPAGPVARFSLAGSLTAVWVGSVMSSGLFPAELGEDAIALRDAGTRLRNHLVALGDLANFFLAARARNLPASDPDVVAAAEMQQRLFAPDGQLATDVLELQRATERLVDKIDKQQPSTASNPTMPGDATVELLDYCGVQYGLIGQSLGSYTLTRGLRIMALLTGHSIGVSSRTLVLRTAAFAWSNRLYPTGSAFALRVRDVRQNITGSLAAAIGAFSHIPGSGDPTAAMDPDTAALTGLESGAVAGVLPSSTRPSAAYLQTTLGDAAGSAQNGQQIVDWAMRLYRSTDQIAWANYQAIALRTALVTTDTLTSAIYAAAQVEAVRGEEVLTVKRAYQFIGEDE